MFTKNWYPCVRKEYEAHFPTEKWKQLTTDDKKEHSLSSCTACSRDHLQLREAFPGKPVCRAAQHVTLSLSETRKREKQNVRKELGELDQQWKGRYGHSYSSVLATIAPEANLTHKNSKIEQKKQNQNLKRSHINKQLGENATLTVLAQSESLQAYKRKRYAMSFETLTSRQAF